MNDSRRTWAIAGLLGILAASGLGILKLANSEYRLIVRVSDADGALAGVWVAVADKDVLTTNSDGFIAVRGTRFHLSSALVTATDSHPDGRHLSRSVLAEVSWNPFRSETRLDIQLPIVETNSDSMNLAQDDNFIAEEQFRIPKQAIGAETIAADSGRIDEVELYDSSALTLGISPSLVLNRAGGADDDGTSLLCQFAGLSVEFCTALSEYLKIPLIHGAPVKDFNASVQVSAGTAEKPPLLETKDSQSLTQPSTPRQETGRPNNVSVVSVSVFHEGEPLPDAAVYMSRLKDSRVIYLGRTSSNGVLTTSVFPQFVGEKLTVAHDCCAPKSFATKTLQERNGAFRINLESGSGFAVMVQQNAYGYLRNTGVFELHGSSGKLSVSNQDGIAFYDAAKTPDVTLQRVMLRNGLPSEYFVGEQSKKNRLTRYLMVANEPYVPTVALIETENEKFHKGVLKSRFLRRWRRDFMARLMQLQSIRTQVSGESEARLNLAQMSLSQIVREGWKSTQIASEWDFVLSVDYNEKEDSLELMLKERGGTTLLQKKIIAQDALPEKVARSHFNELLDVFPFEAHVLSEADGELELSFEQRAHYGLTANSRLALYSHELQDVNTVTSELIGFARLIDGVETGLVKARITHMSPEYLKDSALPSIVRAIKVGENFYSSQLEKNRFASAPTKSL